MRTKTSRLLLGILLLVVFANISASAFYDPGTQRWLNRDPIGERGGINLFEFTYSNPINETDPEGLCVTPETALDVASMAIGAASFGENLGYGNYGAAALDLGGYVVDSLAAITPIVPGGVGASLKAARAAKAAKAKRYSKEKEALVDMAKKDKKTGITEKDMEAYKELNKQLDDPFPKDAVRGPEAHPERKSPSSQQDHGHVGPVDHIPVKCD
jgi:uncharacterized protein RhaS with RHS repeats